MDSKIGLLIQITGVMLITILTLFLQRSFKSTALKYWTYAWLSLSFALFCLRAAFDYDKHASSLYSLYFFGEYLFGYMLVAGCRSLHSDQGVKRPSEFVIIPLGLTAIGLPLVSRDFNEIYSVHCLVVAGFFAAAFLAMRKPVDRSFGWRVMYVSLGLLALDFFSFFAASIAHSLAGTPDDFLKFNSVVDLVLETALGFGMVIVLLERLLAEVRTANAALAAAHSKLEKLVNTDPLTAAFNRHAFYGFVGKGGGDAETVSGCVGFFDIDNLKEINDRYGHAVGDQAIRSVAHSIREVIRAEDLIYRWGGDEFFVVMVGMASEMAETRMQRLEPMLRCLTMNGADRPITVEVSSGFADFKGSAELETAIQAADGEMYRKKSIRKGARAALAGFLPEGEPAQTAITM